MKATYATQKSAVAGARLRERKTGNAFAVYRQEDGRYCVGRVASADPRTLGLAVFRTDDERFPLPSIAALSGLSLAQIGAV